MTMGKSLLLPNTRPDEVWTDRDQKLPSSLKSPVILGVNGAKLHANGHKMLR